MPDVGSNHYHQIQFTVRVGFRLWKLTSFVQRLLFTDPLWGPVQSTAGLPEGNLTPFFLLSWGYYVTSRNVTSSNHYLFLNKRKVSFPQSCPTERVWTFLQQRTHVLSHTCPQRHAQRFCPSPQGFPRPSDGYPSVTDLTWRIWKSCV